jgi:hypothetical protein
VIHFDQRNEQDSADSEKKYRQDGCDVGSARRAIFRAILSIGVAPSSGTRTWPHGIERTIVEADRKYQPETTATPPNRILEKDTQYRFRPHMFILDLLPVYPLGEIPNCARIVFHLGERSLSHTLRSAPSAIGNAPANRNTISPTMRRHSSLW